MNRGEVPPDDRVEGLILAYLDAQATPDDALRMLKRTQSRPPRVRARRPAWLVGLAASLLGLVVVWGLARTRKPVQADALIREAREVQSRTLDRHYRSTATPRPEALAIYPKLKQIEGLHSDLWTRGDRFHVRAEGPAVSFDWGREASGRTWIAPTDQLGLVFEPGEAPEALTVASDLLSLDPEALLDDMLSGFELVEVPADPADGKGFVRIKATPRPGRIAPRMISATIDVDARSKLIRRLTIARGPRGRAAVDVAFTLLDSEPQPDVAYRLEAHIRSDAEVFDHNRPGRRHLILLQHLKFLSGVHAELREGGRGMAAGQN